MYPKLTMIVPLFALLVFTTLLGPAQGQAGVPTASITASVPGITNIPLFLSQFNFIDADGAILINKTGAGTVAKVPKPKADPNDQDALNRQAGEILLGMVRRTAELFARNMLFKLAAKNETMIKAFCEGDATIPVMARSEAKPFDDEVTPFFVDLIFPSALSAARVQLSQFLKDGKMQDAFCGHVKEGVARRDGPAEVVNSATGVAAQGCDCQVPNGTCCLPTPATTTVTTKQVSTSFTTTTTTITVPSVSVSINSTTVVSSVSGDGLLVSSGNGSGYASVSVSSTSSSVSAAAVNAIASVAAAAAATDAPTNTTVPAVLASSTVSTTPTTAPTNSTLPAPANTLPSTHSSMASSTSTSSSTPSSTPASTTTTSTTTPPQSPTSISTASLCYDTDKLAVLPCLPTATASRASADALNTTTAPSSDALSLAAVRGLQKGLMFLEGVIVVLALGERVLGGGMLG